MKKLSQFLNGFLAIFIFVFSANAQEIHIKARFLEMPKSTFDTLQKNFEVASDNTKLLTPEQMRSTMKSFRSDSNIKTLAEPEVVTTNGRQVQMRATQIQPLPFIATRIFEENLDNSSIALQSEKIESDTILNVIPTISSDEEKINITAMAQFETQKASAKIAVPDDHTVLLFLKSSNGKDKFLIVMITPTIVDNAGNRIHSDN